MKTFIKIGSAIVLTLCLTTFIFVSCQNEDLSTEQELTQLDKDVAKIDTLLEDLRSDLASQASKMSDDKMITFEVVKNLTTGKITIENRQEISFFPIDDRSAYFNSTSDSYQVDCDLGNEEDNWSKTCENKWSCGSLINKCLKAGGCAIICNQERNSARQYTSVLVTYIPVK